MVTKEDIDRYIKEYSEGNPSISDEEYDRLLEEYLATNGEDKRPFLRQKQSGSINEIVGTLPKLFGVTKPMIDNRKTYKEWIEKINMHGKIIVQPKFDGCSIAYDPQSNQWFTRGDYDNGESVNVSDLISDTKSIPIRNHVKQSKCDSIKFEAIMSREKFIEAMLDSTYSRPINAVNGAFTSRDKNMIESLVDLISLREIKNGDLYVTNDLIDMSLITEYDDFDGIEEFIKNILKDNATISISRDGKNYTYAIDGVVVSVIDDNGKILDEAAIKILCNIKTTKLITIDWQFGKTGKITPVAVFEPLDFDNRCVTHATLSTIDRVASMELCYGDDIRILYNIVPYFIDNTHNQHGGRIPIIQNCPMCGKPLNLKTMTFVRCTNPNCKGLRIGLIERYCSNMKMIGISHQTIVQLFENDLIDDIADLYELTVDKLCMLPSFKETKANNVINSIKNASTNVPIERWLGSLPIPDVMDKTWKEIIKNLDIKFGSRMETVNTLMNLIENGSADDIIQLLLESGLMHEKTFKKIYEGFLNEHDTIKKLMKHVTFDMMTKVSDRGVITFTGFRNKDLEKMLIDRGFEIGNFSKKTVALIINNKDFTSSKTVKAKQMGIPIYVCENIDVLNNVAEFVSLNDSTKVALF